MVDLNTSSCALKTRISAHANFSNKEINDWIFNIIKPQYGHSILDIGCGTGKQLVPLANMVGARGFVCGIDLSKDSLNCVADALDAQNFKNYSVLQKDMDSIEVSDFSQKFDLIVACFAIYYSADVEKTIVTLKKLLKPSGKLFICGPAKGNNQEYISFLNSVYPSDKTVVVNPFFMDACEALLSKHFEIVGTYTFLNAITFRSAADFMDYWKSYAFGNVPELKEEIQSAVRDHFQNYDKFVTTKVVKGVLVYD